jgi:hypothetical protein
MKSVKFFFSIHLILIIVVRDENTYVIKTVWKPVSWDAKEFTVNLNNPFQKCVRERKSIAKQTCID